MTVKDGYAPNLIRGTAGVPPGLRFDRLENSECTARIVFHGIGDAIGVPGRARPRAATVVRDSEQVEVVVDDVLPGDLLGVRPGERVPVKKGIDDTVIGVTTDTTRSFTMRAGRLSRFTAPRTAGAAL